MVTAIGGAGTPEVAWRPYLDSLQLPELTLHPAPERAVVVAPHPDDEVLGVGGLLAILAAAETHIEVLSVTDGEASHPGGSVPPEDLARLRAAETDAALAVLGLGGPARPGRSGPSARGPVRQRMQLPDGGRDALGPPVLDALRLDPGTWLLAPWEGDGHPDHEAVGQACAAAARRDGARLLAYPVWAWHWAEPGDPRVPWERAVRVDLPAGVQARKARAVEEFGTQIRPLGPAPADAPVLPPYVLERFSRPWEVIFA